MSRAKKRRLVAFEQLPGQPGPVGQQPHLDAPGVRHNTAKGQKDPNLGHLSCPCSAMMLMPLKCPSGSGSQGRRLHAKRTD